MVKFFKYFLFKKRRNKFIEATYKAEDPWSSALHLEAIEHFIKAYVKEDHALILDIGCGEGLYAGTLKSVATRYIGIDVSKTAINRARQANESSRDIFFIQRDFDQIDKNKISADIVCFNFCLDYLGFQKFPLIFSRKLFNLLNATGSAEVLIFNPVYSEKNIQDLEKYLFIFKNFSYYVKAERIYDIDVNYKIYAYYLVKR